MVIFLLRRHGFTFLDKTADNWKTPKGSWVVRKLQSKGSPWSRCDKRTHLWQLIFQGSSPSYQKKKKRHSSVSKLSYGIISSIILCQDPISKLHTSEVSEFSFVFLLWAGRISRIYSVEPFWNFLIPDPQRKWTKQVVWLNAAGAHFSWALWKRNRSSLNGQSVQREITQGAINKFS